MDQHAEPEGSGQDGDAVGVDLAEEDRVRAAYYRLLSRLLAAPPDQAVLNAVAALEGGEGDVGAVVGALAKAAGAAAPAAVDREFQDLFIGVGRGELVPFGSFYLTGFLHEKPLAKLREDMRAMGIARADGVHEPEDHVASLCEIMAGLIEGAFDAPADLTAQRQFFDRHLGPWARRFFADLEAARNARFYMPVGALGRVFMDIEAAAFDMAA